MVAYQNPRRISVLMMAATFLAGVAVWLLWRESGETIPGANARESVRSSSNAELAKSGLISGQVLAPPPMERELVLTTGPRDVEFRFGAGIVGGGPLAGVRLEVVALQEKAVARCEGVTNEAGWVSLMVPPGRYGVRAVHPHYGLVSAPYKREGVITVPCPDVTTEWIPALACGFDLKNGETAAEMERHRFVVDKKLSMEVFSESQAYVLAELRNKGFRGCVDVSFSCDPPSHRTITLFDTHRGACVFKLPLVPVGDYQGPTVCDLEGCPVSEAMGQLEVRVVDAAGFAVSNPMVSIRRSMKYAGVYETDNLAANRVCWIPPGSYKVHYQSPATGDRLIEQVEVLSGALAAITMRLPTSVYEVRLTLGCDGILQVATTAERFSHPVRVSASECVVLGLPEGNAQLCLTIASSDRSQVEAKKCTINVKALREPQDFVVF